MRLNQIKLSGFKSFADPTTFQLPGQRVGVVGPNGCGKSNIIDAVRWVLGESKASELRGESMQDVIFNGSGHRKPAGRASVELVFDNTLARAGGPWNQFSDIAVKRVLTRDGSSSYYINNQPVRRRDVQDVFLGTGLGPRAYAIIGQGTISRIIESRPEELRLFLEEAAGVSKYKERRRETENRLKDTRENLTRVDDILRELNANLDKLERQAEVAGQYRRLQDEGTLKLHQMWFLKHRDAAGEADRVGQAMAEATLALDARLADLRHVEAGLEALRQSHYNSGNDLHLAQGALADAALEVSRLEERIRYVVDSRQRVEQRVAELRLQNAQWEGRRVEAQAELDGIADQMAAAREAASAQAAQFEDESARLPPTEDAVRAALGRANQQRQSVSQVQQQIQVLAADSRHVDEQRRQLRAKGDRLLAETRNLIAPDVDRLEELRQRGEAADQTRVIAQAYLHELQEQAPALEDQRRAQQLASQAEADRRADLSARLDALRALQEKVQTEGRLKPWLVRHGLDALQGLWTRLHIEPGWETALEAALRERLNALEVGRLEAVQAFSADAPPAKLAFYSAQGVGRSTAVHQSLPCLAQLLRWSADDAGLKPLLLDWLEGVYTAADIGQALAKRSQLTHGEVIITRDGHAVSQFAVSFYAPDTEQAGMLARAQEIENLALQCRAQTLIADEARMALIRLEATCSEAAQKLVIARREATESQTRAHELQVELLRLTQAAEAARSRRSQLDDEQSELATSQEALEELRATGEARFEELDLQLADAQERHAGLEDEVLRAEAALASLRESLRRLERAMQESQFQARALVARQAELQRSIQTALAQADANAQTGAQLELELGSLDDTVAQAGLQSALTLKLEREGQLSAQRSTHEALALQLRATEEQRMGLERSLEPMRARITQLQLDQQAAKLGGAQYLEQLNAASADLGQLAAGVAAGGVRLPGLQAQVDSIQREVAALGAVNLAALDELTTARERKSFLDAQNADLNEAIATLEDAIRKIDLETRDLLAQTFEQVNAHFGRMFPSLFGGGTARLVMTGDEILDAGVQVMAQPPGKKNSTIHLLSGGEKALTAIALVFAIFMLNPAPFCLLDEVDAPLDDANTERYSKLVLEMSNKGTQFLFISHNKIAMEMAEQLIGVTMQEQGVSRIVAVDMDAAVSLAEVA